MHNKFAIADNHKYLYFFLLFFISSFNARSQDSLTNTIKFSVISLRDPITPSVEMTYERMLKARRSLQIGFAYLLPSDEFKNKGFKIRTEYRIYKKGSSGPYLAPELMYLYNNYNTSGLYGKQEDTTGYNYIDTFRIVKHIIALTGKVGCQVKIQHFCFDFFTGIGIRFRYIEQFGLKNLSDDPISPKEMNIKSMNNQNEPIGINLSLNIRVGFYF